LGAFLAQEAIGTAAAGIGPVDVLGRRHGPIPIGPSQAPL
jgi:hypothetical protein